MNGSHVCLSFALGMNRDAFALDFHLPAQILLTVNPEPIGQAVLDDARIFGSDRHEGWLMPEMHMRPERPLTKSCAS